MSFHEDVGLVSLSQAFDKPFLCCQGQGRSATMRSVEKLATFSTKFRREAKMSSMSFLPLDQAEPILLALVS